METEVIMKRELFGCEVAQKSKTEYLSATDLVKAGNQWRMMNKMLPFDLSNWYLQKGTKEFIAALEKQFGKVKISGKGRGHHTWVHPYLFIDIALAINPDLKIEVYKWMFDYLLKYRNDSGDSYKKMAGALYANQSNKQNFPVFIAKTAEKIKTACGVDDWNAATEEQLKLRDKIHDSIYLLTYVLKDNDKAVDLSILKTLGVK